MSREILFRAKVLRPDPMTNPESGWVEGFYYQDLCGGEVRPYSGWSYGQRLTAKRTILAMSSV